LQSNLDSYSIEGMKNNCRVPYCRNEIVPRTKGQKGTHHNCCKVHLIYFRRTKNTNRDIHRIIAFGKHKDLDSIRCNGCRDSLIDHWNRHCRFLYKDIELTKKNKQEIVYKLFQVDHINGKRDKDFNSPKNLQILCSNCHDVKSIFSGDKDSWRYKRLKKK
jgi:hypothetical protein